VEEHHSDDPFSAKYSSVQDTGDTGIGNNEMSRSPAATINSPSRVESGNSDPSYSIKIGSHILSASFESGSIAAAYIGTSVLQKGQSTIINGKAVSVGISGIFIDGTVALSATPTMWDGRSARIEAYENANSDRADGIAGTGNGGKPPPIHQTSLVATPKLASSKKKSKGSDVVNSSQAIGVMAVAFVLSRCLLAMLVP
jgi:hypothetical protein